MRKKFTVDKAAGIPDDVLDDLLKFLEKGKRRERQVEKDKWIAKARLSFEPLLRQNCFICGNHRAIVHAHHVIPLAEQFDRGFKVPIHRYVWLCPNHHAIIHAFLDDTLVSNAEHFGGLLAGFTREQCGLLLELLRQSAEDK